MASRSCTYKNQRVIALLRHGIEIALEALHNKGVSIMIEFPLILIGYALLPLIAIQLMIMADRPQKTGEQNAFPQVEIL